MNNNRKFEDSIELLAKRTYDLYLFAYIIDQYFEDIEITPDRVSFVLIMNEYVRHLLGQICGLLFDKQYKDKRTVSVQIILDILKETKSNKDISLLEIDSKFESIKKSINNNCVNLETKNMLIST